MRWIFYIVCFSLFSCSGWLDNQEEEFLESCKSAFKGNYFKKGSDINPDIIDKACHCCLNKIKEDYTFNQFIEKQDSKEIQKIYDSCAEEAFQKK